MKKIIIIAISVIVFTLIAFTINKSKGKQIRETKIEKTETKEEKFSKDNIAHFVYFTGVGCPHCANADPILLKEKISNSDIMVIEYEIYQQKANAPLLMSYDNSYDTGLGVPLLIAGNCKEKTVIGDRGILQNLDKLSLDNKNNCIILSNNTVPFEELDFSELPGLPKIWFKDRIAIKKDLTSKANEIIRDFIINKTIPENAKNHNNNKVALSGDKVEFENSLEIDGWILMYN